MTTKAQLRVILAAVLVQWCAISAVYADEGTEEGEGSDAEQFYTAGNWSLRFGVDSALLFQTEFSDTTTISDSANLGVGVGASYALSSMFVLDADLLLSMLFAPEFDFNTGRVDAGMRFFPIEYIYLRGAVPFVFTSPTQLGFLIGAGYHQALGSNLALFAEIDYPIYFLNEAEQVNSSLVVRGGVETTF